MVKIIRISEDCGGLMGLFYVSEGKDPNAVFSVTASFSYEKTGLDPEHFVVISNVYRLGGHTPEICVHSREEDRKKAYELALDYAKKEKELLRLCGEIGVVLADDTRRTEGELVAISSHS